MNCTQVAPVNATQEDVSMIEGELPAAPTNDLAKPQMLAHQHQDPNK